MKPVFRATLPSPASAAGESRRHVELVIRPGRGQIRALARLTHPAPRRPRPARSVRPLPGLHPIAYEVQLPRGDAEGLVPAFVTLAHPTWSPEPREDLNLMRAEEPSARLLLHSRALTHAAAHSPIDPDRLVCVGSVRARRDRLG